MLVQIEMQDWARHNPRADRANHTWFRFQNNFFNDQKTFLLSDGQRVLLIFVMCEMSKNGSGSLNLLSEFMCAILRRSEEEILKDLQWLHECGLLAVHVPPNDGVMPAQLPATDRQTDRQTNTQTPAAESRLEETTYEFFEEPKKKRERKPKPELPCEVLPAFEAIREILERRRIPTILQQKWEKLYDPRFTMKTVQKADAWAVAKGAEKKNWAQFFNNWLMRDAGGSKAPAAKPSEEPKARQATWWEQQEMAREKREREARGEA